MGENLKIYSRKIGPDRLPVYVNMVEYFGV